MKLPVVSINGLAIGNFNIPYNLVFDTGDCLPACSDKRAAALQPDPKIDKYYCEGPTSLWTNYDMAPKFLSHLEVAMQSVDILLVNNATLRAIHYQGMFGKFSKLRTYDEDKKDCLSSTEFYARY